MWSHLTAGELAWEETALWEEAQEACLLTLCLGRACLEQSLKKLSWMKMMTMRTPWTMCRLSATMTNQTVLFLIAFQNSTIAASSISPCLDSCLSFVLLEGHHWGWEKVHDKILRLLKLFGQHSLFSYVIFMFGEILYKLSFGDSNLIFVYVLKKYLQTWSHQRETNWSTPFGLKTRLWEDAPLSSCCPKKSSSGKKWLPNTCTHWMRMSRKSRYVACYNELMYDFPRI